MRRRNLYVGQSSMMELIMSGIILIIVILVINFFITSYYTSKIKNLYIQNEYRTASLAYRIVQSDQMFSLTSRERGFLDKVKLHVFVHNDPSKACELLRSMTHRKVSLIVRDIESNNNQFCNGEETYDHCNSWYICENNPKGSKYDLFVSLYDPLNDKISIGKLEIWIED